VECAQAIEIVVMFVESYDLTQCITYGGGDIGRDD